MTITGRQLLEELQAHPELLDLPVMIQKDPEGNGFFWAHGLDADCYTPEASLKSDRTDEVVEVEDTGAVLDPNMEPEDREYAIKETGYVRVLLVFP